MDIGQKELPVGWRWAKLADVCQINPKRPSMDWKPGTKTNFVPMSSVDAQTGEIIQLGVKNYSEISRGYTYFEEGDVLFAKITPCMQNGKHAVASGLLNGFAFGSTEFHVLRPNEQIIPGWIHKFLRQPTTWQKLSRHFRGAVGQQRVPKKFLGELSIPIPPLEEQRRIARILNEQMVAVGEAKKVAQQQLDTVHALPTAYLRKVFPSSEDELPAGWKWVKMKDACDVILGQSPPSSAYRKTPEGLPFFQGKTDFGELNPQAKTWCTKPKKIAEAGDILISVRAPVGPTNLADRKCCIGRGLAALRCNTRAEKDFILAVLKLFEAKISKMGSGSTFSAITGKQLRELPLPLPPLEEQRQIISELNGKLANVKLIEASVQQQLDTIYALPATLLRKAFSGEI